MKPGSVAADTDERPFVLIWEVTQACNLQCEHCRADAQPERHPAELDTTEGKELLDAASAFGDGQLVVLSGGDPLKRDDLPELIRHGTDRDLRMTLTPSGTSSLTPDTIDELADAGVERIALSLDGSSAERHDSFRGENGSFDQTVSAAQYIRDRNIPLQVNTTVTEETVSDLPQIADLTEELGAILWSVFFLVPIGRGRVLDPITPETSDRVMRWLLEQSDRRPYGIKTTEAPHYRRVARKTDRSGTGQANPMDSIGRRTGIRAGDGFAFVSHTGEVFPSGFLPVSAGNVRRESIVDLYRNSDLFEGLRNEDDYRGKCGACEYRHVCGGSRSRAFAYTGDPLESDPLCPYVPDGYDGPLPQRSLPDLEAPDPA
ncbi:MAG: TIGR04053 family radical SAM/SPASM domain-containing protein [Halodesulfurarchaeum sp.]